MVDTKALLIKSARVNRAIDRRSRPKQSGRAAKDRENEMQTNISVENGQIIVTGPYSEQNNAEWRSLGGKFSVGSWVMRDTPAAREKIAAMFGAKSDEVDAIVPSSMLRDGAIVQIGGYVLAQRRGRDWAVQMPDGVSLETGKLLGHGGSVKNPRVGIGPGDSFRLRCRRSFAEANKLQIAPADATATLEI